MQLCQPERIVKPLQCHFGAEDTLVGFSDPSAAASLEEKLNAGGVHFQLYRYPGVGHGFMNTRSDEPQITASRRAKTGFPPTNKLTRWSSGVERLCPGLSCAAGHKAANLSTKGHMDRHRGRRLLAYSRGFGLMF
eukprot:scaffold1034_cov418-Prasinococcus_capsulatus_cf.AAC.25